MDQGWAIVLAAVGAALAGLFGVLLGGKISANTARDTAKTAADAARESARVSAEAALEAARAVQAEAQSDREDARQARFADRIRELAVSLSHGADAAILGVQNEVGERQVGYISTTVSVKVDPGWDRWIRELHLVSRRSETRDATDRLDTAVGQVLGFAVQGRPGGAVTIRIPTDGWDEAEHECRDALDAFESAVQAELGVDHDTASPRT